MDNRLLNLRKKKLDEYFAFVNVALAWCEKYEEEE